MAKDNENGDIHASIDASLPVPKVEMTADSTPPPSEEPLSNKDTKSGISDLHSSINVVVPETKLTSTAEAGEPLITTPESSVHIRKEANDSERALNLDEYSEILCKFFLNAEGEFCFGLLGEWGRGKTFLAKALSKILQQEHNFEIVHFNAWKYRETPDVWVFLYETFCDQVKKSNFFRTFCTAVRANFFKRGFLPLIIFVAYILFILLPFYLKLKWAFVLITVFGVTNLYFTYRICSKITIYSKLKKHYGTIISHRERLGIQEVIGADLKNLIKSIVPQKIFKCTLGIPHIILKGVDIFFEKIPEKLKSIYRKCQLVDEACCYLCRFSVFYSILPIVFISAVEFLIYFYHIVYTNISFPLITLTIAVHYIFIIVFFIPLGTIYAKDKILLVIDDIDRCEPKQIISIIESLKLLLEDEEIHQRLQVLFIAEEDKFRFSIYKRFEEIIEDQALFPTYTNKLNNDIVNGHIEKIVTTYLKLPKLSAHDQEELLEKIFNSYKAAEASNGKSNQIVNQGSKDIDKKSSKTDKKTLYSPEEERLLSSEILLRTENWTPRRIRLFLFKYQLGRLIGERLNLHLDKPQFINALKKAMNNESYKDILSQDPDLATILNQIH